MTRGTLPVTVVSRLGVETPCTDDPGTLLRDLMAADGLRKVSSSEVIVYKRQDVKVWQGVVREQLLKPIVHCRWE